ncbi:hypothetical protein [Zhihengliuella alba]
MHPLDFFQPVEQAVELRVRDQRLVLVVVRETVLPDVLDELLVFLTH